MYSGQQYILNSAVLQEKEVNVFGWQIGMQRKAGQFELSLVEQKWL
ncbi:MAG: hypothetical protein MH252_06280 [Thermosynechococcaceae cyanobacterium MS004]|nr:hypothetical protein [Thermosynechococcaceae cyanobacterium MS004]